MLWLAFVQRGKFQEVQTIDKNIRVNQRIRAREVRVIDDQNAQLGIMPPQQALRIAEERGLDLVEVAPTAQPPVCRIMDYGKYLYQLNKKLHEAKKHQKNITVKEVKFRPNTDDHDYDFKKNHIIRFLRQGDKVKATVFFRGREIVHQGIGRALLERLVEELAEIGAVEARPKMEGPNLIAIFTPKKSEGGAKAHKAHETKNP
ncbi:MAG: translation initiation factor IF-3 [Acidobacteria bacterium]|nr:translation initiation factor IF-3 [Acidobacteriota bacterium]